MSGPECVEGTSGRVSGLSGGLRTEEGAATKPNRLSVSLRREPILHSCPLTSTHGLCTAHSHKHANIIKLHINVNLYIKNNFLKDLLKTRLPVSYESLGK